MNAVGDGHYSQHMITNDDVFRTKLPPPQTGLPHDLSEMYPTPPSQEPQLQATSPATSVSGDYANPANMPHCHAVMSPEKHIVTLDRRYEELGASEGIEVIFILCMLFLLTRVHWAKFHFFCICELSSIVTEKKEFRNSEKEE